MTCSEARERLAAWQDAELSPGETAQVEEHLRTCADCQRRDRSLSATRPRPDELARVPAAVLASLDARLDPDLLLAAARTPAAEPELRVRLGTWLRREARVPMGLVVAYLLILLAALGFGVSGLLPATAPGPTVTDVHAIPADQFRPASYDPGPAGADGVE